MKPKNRGQWKDIPELVKIPTELRDSLESTIDAAGAGE